MKAIKKILAVLLAGALVFGFAACSSDDDGGNSSSETGKTDENSGSETGKTGESSGDTKVEKPAASSQDNPFKGTEWMCYDFSNVYNSVGIQIEKDKLKGVMIYRVSDYKDYILSESYTVTKNGDSYTASSEDFTITINSKDATYGVITCSHFGLNNKQIVKQ